MSDAARFDVLSVPRPVSMGDDWFEIAHLDHFWIVRRFEVLRRLCDPILSPRSRVAEVGCGIGLVQAQFERELGLSVDGFDLNAKALERNLSQRGTLRSYDVYDRHAALERSYDLLLLLDVIEHVEDDTGFVDAAAFLVDDGGHLVINVPASPALFSRYDEAAGHLRRYTPEALLAVGQDAGLDLVGLTYWGLPLLPAAIARKLFVRGGTDAEILRTGFRPPGTWANRALTKLARLEAVPQQRFGTSLLALFRRSAR